MDDAKASSSNGALGIRGLGASLEAPPLNDLLKQAAATRRTGHGLP
jgi:hypothetical protein